MIVVETGVSGDWDSKGDWPALAERAVRAAVAASAYAGLLAGGPPVEVSVKFAGDEEARALNLAWRGKDRPTNVLSFPMIEPDALERLAGAAGGEALLGDVVLAHHLCAAEAAGKGVPIENHAAHLVVHGTLHLLGYDHERNPTEADRMESAERAALAAMGIADPYLSEVQS
jgi:probable rRNA maturation factor